MRSFICAGLWIGLAVGLLAIAACGGDDPSGGATDGSPAADGSTPSPTSGEIGSPCVEDGQCEDNLCLLERGDGFFPDGYCSRVCDGTTAPCPAGAFCLGVVDGNCFQQCADQGECREGYSCTQAPGPGSPKICFPS